MNRHYGPSKLAAITWFARVGWNLCTHAVCQHARHAKRRCKFWWKCLGGDLTTRERVGLVVTLALFAFVQWVNVYSGTSRG